MHTTKNDELNRLKDYVFDQVIMRLDYFIQDMFFKDGDMYTGYYFSPEDFVIGFSPDEYEVLMEYRQEWLKKQ